MTTSSSVPSATPVQYAPEATAGADAVLILDSRVALHTHPARLEALLARAHQAGIPSACMPSSAPAYLSVDYWSNPSFRYAMGGVPPEVNDRGDMTYLTPEALRIKAGIDASLRQHAQDIGLNELGRLNIGARNPYSGHVHGMARESNSFGMDCP